MITPVIRDIYVHCEAVAKRGIMREYRDFIDKCLEGLDENAVDPDDLMASAARLAAIKSCWSNGTIIGTDSALQSVVEQFRERVREVETQLFQEVDRALINLCAFAVLKSEATRRRLFGQLASASEYERQAEVRYRQLPNQWRW